MPPNPDVSRPFKVLTGRLFGQLHSRAARRPDVSDVCFQARDLQHARFLRGVLPMSVLPVWEFQTSACNREACAHPSCHHALETE